MRRGTSRPRRTPRPRRAGWRSLRLSVEEQSRVAHRLTRRERWWRGPVEVQEHRMLVAGEPLRAHRAFGGALLGEPPEAREREAALGEELGDQSEGEHAPETALAGARHAGIDDRLPDAAPAGLRLHGERPHLREVGGQRGERAAAEKSAVVLRDEEVREVRAEE